MNRHTLPQQQTGFSLGELLVTVAIIGIIAAYAVPSFNNLMVSERIKSASFDTMASLSLARSEAIKQNGAVTLTPTSGTTSWANGWTITDSSAAVISTQAAYPSSILITGSAASIVYNRSGRPASAADITLQVASSTAGSSVTPRCVKISLSGQPKSTAGSC